MSRSVLGDIIRSLRQSAGLTPDELSSLSNISRSTLLKIESGATPDPGFFVVARLLALCKASAEAVLDLHHSAFGNATARHIGVSYEGRELHNFVAWMQSERVQTVADVRLTPISRKRGFSKSRLSEALADAGIRYQHFPVLGNPKANRAGYADPSDDTPRAIYRSRLETPGGRAALDQLAGLTSNGPVGVLCFEADQSMCHRNEILQELSRRVVG